ncbi:MAG TPA: protein TolQ [Kofleriaceae bacterium]|nr:protein TolQ [Kofleriaceae bacterium]
MIAQAGDLGTWSLVTQASPVVKGVMALLALMSIFCWYIIGYKHLYIRKAARETELFTESFWRSRDIEHIYKSAQALRSSPVSSMFVAGYNELAKLSSDQGSGRDRDADLANIQRALRKAQTSETTKLEAMIPFLATTGSAAPFIGLFGTVWGILVSFREIGAKKSVSLDFVAPHIAEALFATAVGLVAAIPAVMAYNYFVRRIRVQVSAMETFEQDYLNIIRRHFLK